LPPNVRDWLPETHLVWFVLDVVGVLDLKAFHAKHPNDSAGRRAYDPEMMLALLVYAYCTGVRSSRRIAAACRTDLAMKAICCDILPEHDAIGRFRSDHETAIADAFVDVLALCAKAGLASLGIVAIDGTKMGTDAALDANRTESSIREEVERLLAEAQATDATEAAQPSFEGDLPEAVAHPGSRLGRLERGLAEISAARQQAEREAAEQAERWHREAAQGHQPRGAAPSDPARALTKAAAAWEAAKVNEEQTKGTLGKLDATEQRRQAEQRLEEAQKAADEAPDPPELQANTTDPESKIMKTRTGWVQGYNPQAAVNEHQVVIAGLVTNEANDVGQLVPVMALVAENAALAEVPGPIGIFLADAGYWSEANATADGPDRMIATKKDWKQRRAARELGTTTGEPPEGASPLEAMEHRLRTEQGAATYAMRSYTVEPTFGNVKENKGFRRFMRRGLSAAHSEWSLICQVQNILKLFDRANGRTLNQLLAAQA
jgi:transposase